MSPSSHPNSRLADIYIPSSPEPDDRTTPGPVLTSSSSMSSMPPPPSSRVHGSHALDGLPHTNGELDGRDGPVSRATRSKKRAKAERKEEAVVELREKEEVDHVPIPSSLVGEIIGIGGKRKQQADEDDDADFDAQSEARKKGTGKTRKGAKDTILRAKVAVWRDLPDWGDRVDRPLLELPGEILDMCFGADQDLALRDWVSLAGVNRFFRERLDDDFFHVCFASTSGAEIWSLRDKARHDKRVSGGKSPLWHVKNLSNGTIGHPATHPFTRDIPSWRSGPTLPPPPAPLSFAGHFIHQGSTHLHRGMFYTPRGPRKQWTKEQYTIYKEDKAKFAEEVQASRDERAKEDAATAKRAREGRSITVGNGLRKVLAEVRGLEDGDEADGDEAGPVDEAGMPVPSLPAKHKSGGPAKKKARQTAKEGKKISKEGWALWEAAKVPKWLRDPAAAWVVPESDGEDELEHYRPVLYDGNGAVIPDDYWPSIWRKRVVEEVNGTWVSGEDAIIGYGVTKADLLSLRHVLIADADPNKRTRINTKLLHPMYSAAAVEALAYRSHGGPTGHAKHMAMIRSFQRAPRRGRRHLRTNPAPVSIDDIED
ncbi:uncharacterized protein MKK02DRAFT_29023 [Dioszegia hungarica]|uniref:Uncharacterized protein n=1 Tax=Dioszegia hungarica TaxID=4972 RepID=A0AA38LTX3_9TREE|nr:uncharacterized protein MKK02DRAFT_29023 [Dioszegia hungarica]KAI9633121.1 hypothetical protein MKK02DRAFT_29023 [Dioszegia hungarica]